MRRVVVGGMICSLLAGPVWAEQVVLDGQEFRAHVERDTRVQAERDGLQAERDNLAQQNALLRNNERNYKAVIQRLKELDAKTEEKDKAQQELLATYETQRGQLVQQQAELTDEVRRVKREKDTLTWTERGKGFFVGLLAATAVAVYVIRGGR